MSECTFKPQLKKKKNAYSVSGDDIITRAMKWEQSKLMKREKVKEDLEQA